MFFSLVNSTVAWILVSFSVTSWSTMRNKNVTISIGIDTVQCCAYIQCNNLSDLEKSIFNVNKDNCKSHFKENVLFIKDYS